MSSSCSSLTSMATTAAMRMLRMRMRMTTTEETPLHPLLLHHPTPTPPAAALEVIVVNEEDPMEMVPEQEAPEAHDVIFGRCRP
jgi:hypothetical protein